MTSTPSSESLTASRPNVTIGHTQLQLFDVKYYHGLEMWVNLQVTERH